MTPRIVPKDRTMTREQYKYLSRMLRIVWRERGDAIRKAVDDLAIYGYSELRL